GGKGREHVRVGSEGVTSSCRAARFPTDSSSSPTPTPLPNPLHSPSTSPACACVSVSSPLVDPPPSLSLFKLLGGGD
ncbi:unnamed protein product, partial [Musa acuminata var. zebrina]